MRKDSEREGLVMECVNPTSCEGDGSVRDSWDGEGSEEDRVCEEEDVRESEVDSESS